MHWRNSHNTTDLTVCERTQIRLKLPHSMDQYRTRDHRPVKYLGVTLDRTLSYKQHIHNTKMKVATRNNLLRKLANSKWGKSASTIRTTAIALCYSVAEYAAPVWARSHHAHVLDSELKPACRAITGSMKPTNVEYLYLLARVEKKQESNVALSLHGQNPTESRLKSRCCFLSSVYVLLISIQMLFAVINGNVC